MLRILTEQERQIIEERWGLNDDLFKTQAEVAKIIGITRQRIQQIETSALNKIRAKVLLKQIILDSAPGETEVS